MKDGRERDNSPTPGFRDMSKAEKIEEKILSALERVHVATKSSLQKAVQQQNLSPLHAQILHYLDNNGPQGVSILATQLRVTKATISDSVASLHARKFVKKLPDKNDGRSHRVALTVAGEKEAVLLASYAAPFLKSVSTMDEAQKQALWEALLNLLKVMQAQGLIPPARMCATCRHFEQKSGGGYCRLMEINLAIPDLRVNCAEHQQAA